MVHNDTPMVRNLIVDCYEHNFGHVFYGFEKFCSIWCYMASVSNANGNSNVLSIRAIERGRAGYEELLWQRFVLSDEAGG